VGAVGSTRDTIKNLLISKGPLSVSLSMDGSFSGGIYQCAAGATVDHAVVLVGYNNAGGYWIVRNSWGSTWNGNGYFNVGYGQCSIEDYVYYGTVAKVVSTPKTPSGTITDTTPTFTWTKITGATQYQYELKKGGTVVYTKTASSGLCGTSTCSQTPTTALAYASYTWHVRAYVSGGWKVWSASKAFTVANPNIPVLQTPSGTTTIATPTYTWTTVLGATQYQYEMVNGTTTVYTKTVISSLCGATTCSDTPSEILAADSYTWRARAMVNGTWRIYSAYKSFTVTTSLGSQLTGDATGVAPAP
jgi:hypothetical protein